MIDAYKTAEAEILRKLDLRAEAEALGVRFVGTPTAAGWLDCTMLRLSVSLRAARARACALWADTGAQGSPAAPPHHHNTHTHTHTRMHTHTNTHLSAKTESSEILPSSLRIVVCASCVAA